MLPVIGCLQSPININSQHDKLLSINPFFVYPLFVYQSTAVYVHRLGITRPQGRRHKLPWCSPLAAAAGHCPCTGPPTSKGAKLLETCSCLELSIYFHGKIIGDFPIAMFNDGRVTCWDREPTNITWVMVIVKCQIYPFPLDPLDPRIGFVEACGG